MEDEMEDFWYDMEWKISGIEWNCMEDFACYGRWKICIPFHSMPCLEQPHQEHYNRWRNQGTAWA